MRITREKSLPAGERDPQDDLRRDTLNTHQLLRADAIAIGYRRSLQRAAVLFDSGRRAATPICDLSPLAVTAQRRHILARDVLNSWESGHADGQDDTPLRRIGCFRYRSRRVPVLASQCRASEQEAESQRVASNTNARRAKAREVREPNAVYWGCSTKMGADPDPFIRSQILRDASGFFGGLD